MEDEVKKVNENELEESQETVEESLDVLVAIA